MIFLRKEKKILTTNHLKDSFKLEADTDFFSHGNFKKLIAYQKKLILEHLTIKKEDILLDLGCGMGYQLSTLANLIHKGFGIDWSKTMIEKAQKCHSNNNITFSNSTCENIDKFHNHNITKIICIGAFEHFLDHKSILLSCHKILQKNGQLFIMTQNKSVCWHQITKFTKHGLKHNSSDTFFSGSELKTLLKETNFNHIKITYWKFIPSGDIHSIFNIFFSCLQHILGWLFPKYFKGGLIATITK